MQRQQSFIPLLSTLLHGAVFIALTTAMPAVGRAEAVVLEAEWIPSLDVGLTVLIDGLSLTFALLISGIGTIISIYSARYLADHQHRDRFFLFLMVFSIGMLGLVLAGNLITLFVFWELTTIASYLLVGYKHSSADARRSALQALLITAGGGLALLAGFIMLGSAAGTFELVAILNSPESLTDHALYLPILILVLLGAFTKSAQLPFHFWLPNAMAAPTPASAFLHSATMVKAGIYLLARLHPTLSGTAEWTWTLTLIGAATALFASIATIRQTDLKLALAYTTLMALGTLTMFLGAEETVAIAAAMTFLIVHCFYKASLFLVVGAVEYSTGTRDVDRLGKLAGAMPFIAFAAFASGLSMAGFPPFLGFIGKELKYEGALAIASEPYLVAGVAVLSNALMVAAVGLFVLRPFLRQPPQPRPGEAPLSFRPVPWQLWVGPVLLSILGLIFGVTPGFVEDNLIQPSVSAVLGQPESVTLKLWHGVNIPLMMSIATLLLGILIYALHQPIVTALHKIGRAVPLSADRTWDGIVNGMLGIARWQTSLLQGGVLRHYLAIVLTTLTVLVGGTLIYTRAISLPADPPPLLFKEWVILALLAGGTVVTAFTRSRLLAICGLSAVGMGVALVFLLFGAPDLAITQLMVETLVVVLVAVVMLRFPLLGGAYEFSAGWNALRIGVSALVGVITTLTLVTVLNTPFDRSLTSFFEQASVPEAYGRNIVNVILVDFRALDTFGEILVVAVAGIASYAIIRRVAPQIGKREEDR